MNSSEMFYLTNINGLNVYVADNTFEKPGLWYWDGCNNIHPVSRISSLEQQLSTTQAELEEWKENAKYNHNRAEAKKCELEKAHIEASSLALYMWKHHYKEESPCFSLCDSVAGIITQIDNMYTGIRDKLTATTTGRDEVAEHNVYLTDRLVAIIKDMHAIDHKLGDALQRAIYAERECEEIRGEYEQLATNFKRLADDFIKLQGETKMSENYEKQYKKIIEQLWNIIDEIDTIGDIAKSDDKLYRGLVEQEQKKRWATGILCDGHNLNIDIAIKTEPATKPVFSLQMLLDQVTSKNLHSEVLSSDNLEETQTKCEWKVVNRKIVTDCGNSPLIIEEDYIYCPYCRNEIKM
jgi:molecular chaperone GrpE (heat shock protein)